MRLTMAMSPGDHNRLNMSQSVGSCQGSLRAGPGISTMSMTCHFRSTGLRIVHHQGPVPDDFCR